MFSSALPRTPPPIPSHSDSEKYSNLLNSSVLMIKTEPLLRFLIPSDNFAVRCLYSSHLLTTSNFNLTFPKDVENDKFSIPPLKNLMRYKVVVTSCLDAGILTGARCTNSMLGMLEHSVVNVIHPTHVSSIKPHWSHLLIDEVHFILLCFVTRDHSLLQAAQGSEPELLVPISVVLPFSDSEDKTSHKASVTPQLVLCGDPNQCMLPPYVFDGNHVNGKCFMKWVQSYFLITAARTISTFRSLNASSSELCIPMNNLRFINHLSIL